MPLPQRQWLYHNLPPWVGDAAYFITICCKKRGIDQLCKPEISSQLFAAVSHYHESKRWYVSLWLLMPDHIHALVSCPATENLTTVVAAWKRYTANSVGIVWQRGFFDHRLRNDESFDEKAVYIRMNPVRKGLAIKPEDWPHIWTPQTVQQSQGRHSVAHAKPKRAQC